MKRSERKCFIYFFIYFKKKPKKFDAKPSALPAFEAPHPGTSYNPSYEDHQDLLLEAHVIELEKLKKEERRIRNLDSKIPKMTYSEIENLWLKEMTSDLVNHELVEEDENDKKAEEEVESEGKSEKKLNKKQKTKVQKQRNALIEKLRVN